MVEAVSKVNEGLCAGGPKDGHTMAHDWTIEKVMVPEIDTEAGGFHYRYYVWHPLLRMWVWEK